MWNPVFIAKITHVINIDCILGLTGLYLKTGWVNRLSRPLNRIFSGENRLNQFINRLNRFWSAWPAAASPFLPSPSLFLSLPFHLLQPLTPSPFSLPLTQPTLQIPPKPSNLCGVCWRLDPLGLLHHLLPLRWDFCGWFDRSRYCLISPFFDSIQHRSWLSCVSFQGYCVV